jgi:Carboxypeptidase regulatory-like domain
MRMLRALRLLAPLFVVLLAALSGIAQVDYSTATLKGTVLDVQGGGVPGATVTITNPATGLTKTQKSGPEGGYQFPLLPVGTYEVDVVAQGFDKAVAKDIVLAAGEASVVDMHLTVGASNVVVEVTTAAPLIATEQVQQADAINQEQVAELPNVSRTFDTYAQTLPGISNAAAVHDSGSQRAIGAFPVNAFTTSGGSGRGGLVTIDGGENDYGSGVARIYYLPVDAIQEFQVNRNGYNAEYGFSSNEAVSIVTKAGTNTFHGAAFADYRDEATDAGQYFQPLGPDGNRLFDQNTHLGGNFGGALIKDKLFVFMAYEGYQTAFKAFSNFQSPSILGTGTDGLGALSPALSTPGSATNPGEQQAYVQAIEATGGACGPETCATLASDLTTALIPANSKYIGGLLGTPGNPFGVPDQSGTFVQRDTWNSGVIRFDWQPSASNSIFIRGLAETDVNPGGFGGAEFGQIANLPPDSVTGSQIRDYEVLAGWTHIFSPTMFNVLRVQAVPESIANVPYIASTGGTTAPFNIIGSAGFGSFGPVIGSQGYFSRERRFQFEDSISITRGNHSFKVGASYRPAKYEITNNLYANSQIVYLPGFFNIFGLGGPTCALAALNVFGQNNPFLCEGGALGAYTAPLSANDINAIAAFNSMSAGNLGLFDASPLNALQAYQGVLPVQFRTSFGSSAWNAWGHYGGIYAQDAWKITPRLTINAGMRFDVNAEPFPQGGAEPVCEPQFNNAAAFPSAATIGTTSCTGAAGDPVGTLDAFTENPEAGETFYWSPRVGLAFDIFGDHKTVLRASGGAYVGTSEIQTIFYSNVYNPDARYLTQEEITLGQDNSYFGLIDASAANGRLPVFPPNLLDYQEAGLPNAGKAGQPHAVTITSGDHACPPVGGQLDPFGCGTYRSAYSTQASLSIQRELMPNLSLEVGYDFQRTFHLQIPLEVNFTQAKDPTTGAPLTDPYLGPMLIPINPNVETGTLYCSCGDAWYHGLTATLTRRFSNHLQFVVNYTYSRSIDDQLDFSSFNSTFFPTIWPFGVNHEGRDYGQSAYNLTHLVKGNMVYTTPFDSSSSNILDKVLADITLANIVTVNSGIPFQVLINPGQGLAGECLTTATCDAGDATSNGLVQEALNQARPFAAPRNSGIGPWDARWDMAIRKAIYINKERGLRLEVSANLENLLNHTNFLGVDGVFAQPQAANFASGPQAVPLLKLPGQPQQFVNLLSGPYNFHGIKAFDNFERASNGEFALGSQALNFVSADVPRLAQFELRLSF